MNNRVNNLMPNGEPKYIRCYDNGGETFDRYTVVFTGHYTHKTNGGHVYLGMSIRPFDYQGYGQHGDSDYQCIDVNKWGFAPMIGRKNHLGTRIPFSQLPVDCKTLVIQDYKNLWDLEAVQ